MIKQVWHPYQRWEDYQAGMWRKEQKEKEQELLSVAIEFTGDHIKYGAAMMEVIKTWKYSCEHNLSNLQINRRAWVGHAACAYSLKLPEYLVREAWGKLNDYQRFMANKMADNAIAEWERIYKNKGKPKRTQLSLW
jgi:hypothetical protein